jgi:hypothetical protein
MKKSMKLGLYELSVVLFFAVLPIGASAVEMVLNHAVSTDVLLKWFTFSGIGLRLFSCGLKQVVNPAFTASEIFEIKDDKCNPLVRELGFANICFGTLGALSLFVPGLRIAAALAGGLYLGLAGFMHLFRKGKNKSELFAMLSDFWIFTILAVLIMLAIAGGK